VGVVQTIGCLLSKHEALSANLYSTKKNKRKENDGRNELNYDVLKELL
jgi:hypothetical protein